MKKRFMPWRALGLIIPVTLLVVACGEDYVTTPGTQSEEPTPSRRQQLDSHMFLLTAELPPVSDLEMAIEELGATIDRRLDPIGVFTVSGLTDDQAATLSERADVQAVSRDVSLQWIPGREELGLELSQNPAVHNDPSLAGFFSFWQWNMRQIDADDAWPVSSQGEGTTVAVLDTGGDTGHQDLAGVTDAARSISMLSPGSSPCNFFLGLPDEETFFDLNFHGSFVSALIASNGIAMASVAPHTSIVAVKVLSCVGSGSFSDVNAGIMYAADLGVDVINMSLGALLPDHPVFDALIEASQRAVKYAKKQGVLVVAAAGNQGLNLDEATTFFLGEEVGLVHLPSMLKDVVSVSALGPTAQVGFDDIAPYSNRGKTKAKGYGRPVDIAAPGGAFGPPAFNIRDGILSVCGTFVRAFTFAPPTDFGPFCPSGFTYFIGGNGTSFSSPEVAGAAAVIQSDRMKKKKGKADPNKLENCLFKGADDLGDPGRDPLYGEGRLNVLGSITAGGCT